MLKLFKKWKIYNIFYVLLLKQNIIRKKGVDKNIIWLDFKTGNSKEYNIKKFKIIKSIYKS